MGQYYTQACAALERGDLEAAFTALNAGMGSDEAGNPDVYHLLGDVLLSAGMPAEAGEAFETAATKSLDGFPHLKSAMLAFDRAVDPDRAFLLAMRAMKLRTDDPDVIFVIARELHKRGDLATLVHFQNRLTASDNPVHLDLAKQLIGHDNRNPFNATLFQKLAERDPDNPFLRFKVMSIARELCDYPTIEAEKEWMNSHLATQDESIFEGETPYANLLHCSDERLNRLAVNNASIPHKPMAGAAERRRAKPHVWGERIRIGYLSSDFSSTHATMRLLRHVLELHDRTRFDITLYCHTPQSLIDSDDGGRSQWGRIVSIRDLSDAQAAAQISADGIDILIDLKGHTGGSRCQIFNIAPAPILAGWLGFPGSTVHVDLDYVIGDRYVLPDSAAPHYHEKFVRLPTTYQPNDPMHRTLPAAGSRQALGLPEDRFVFASFNAHRKITLTTIALWADILKGAENSILWVMIDIEAARRDFAARIAALGIDTSRIIFTDMVPYPEHIARLQAADLGLDTFPYNGHTTTSDMLWAGLPVLTKRGSNFASRVSESLLTAVGLPELVTSGEQEFVSAAIALAQSKQPLVEIREKLNIGRALAPLFDSKSFTRDLESAYQMMVTRAKSGQAPAPIDL